MQSSSHIPTLISRIAFAVVLAVPSIAAASSTLQPAGHAPAAASDATMLAGGRGYGGGKQGSSAGLYGGSSADVYGGRSGDYGMKGAKKAKEDNIYTADTGKTGAQKKAVKQAKNEDRQDAKKEKAQVQEDEKEDTDREVQADKEGMSKQDRQAAKD
ncbi:MAG TPA: hypothetical protein VGK20_09450 [Candidatus Binatia bacterium]|jgi:hypothetical protein